jgi:small multidrug resistance pump
MPAWLYLAVAIVLEVGGTIALRMSRGFEVLAPTLVALVLYCLSLTSLNLALKELQVGVAYAIWSGVGTTVIALLGIVFFREPASVLKLVSLVLVIAGLVGLNLRSTSH